MTDIVRCPDCGHQNPSGSESCAQCNFPLATRADEPPAPGSHADPHVSETRTEPPAAETPFNLPPRRRPRPRPASNQALSLWLMFAFVAAASVVFIAVKANVERSHQPVEGSNKNQQEQANQFLEALAKDSTNVDAHIGLANVLYDTANWKEAIVHYRAALRGDSSRTSALVDLGVCYYNLSDSDEAERAFRLALQRDPHQAVALFNLGIVSERRSEWNQAFEYYHRALQSAPPEEMKQAIMDAMQRIQEAQGKKAPPLPDGR